MALPIAGFYTSTGGVITTHDFGSVEAGAYKPGSTGWSFRLYNNYGSTASDDMTSVKMSIRGTTGGTDQIWVQQHWVQIKSSSGSTGVVDDAQTVFTAVGKNKELSLGDIPSNQYRTLFARCYPPTDAAEQKVEFQLRATYQKPATSICNWITGLRGNGVVATTGDPFAMSTGGTTGTIPYTAGYALIYNNEVYYGSSGTFDCSTGSSSTGHSIYLNESGAFGMTTGDVAANQLLLYGATISSGVCTNLVDKRVYLAGLQSGTTGAMPPNPDLGDLYLGTNGKQYIAKTAGTYTEQIISATQVEVSEIGMATYDDVQDFINNTQSGGRISGGTIASDSSGGITISSGTGFTKTTTGDIGLTKSFDWAAGALVSTGLTDDSTNYIYMDYNADSPQILATNDRTTIRLQDQFTLGRVYKSGTDIHIINSGVNLYNSVRRMHEVKIEISGFQRASGGVITESDVTERALNSTVGIFFLGDNEIVTSAKDTSTGNGDYFTSWYYDGADWQSTTGETQIDKLQYNASTGLANLTANRYGVHWAYIHYDSDIQTVYGQGDYTLAQAEIATIPDSLPSAVNDFGTLAAKIILQQGSTGFTSVVTAYKTLFPVSSPADHSDLGGLQGGTVDEYYHLTNSQHSELTDWAGAVTLSTGGTIDIPSGQEYRINGAEVKLDEWATPTTGTALNSSTGRHGLLIALDGTTGNFLRGDGSWQTPPAGVGEANTASNAGTTGIGIYYQKDGVDLEFKAIHSTGNISVTDSTGTITVNLDIISTGIKLDDLGTPDNNTDLNATTGHHGLLPIGDADTTHYLAGDISWVSTTGIVLDSLATPTTGTALNATTGVHGLMKKLSGNAYDVINGDGNWKTSDQVRKVTTKTTTGTLAVGEAGLVCVSATGDYTLTMPASSGNTGLTYRVKKTDFNYNTITFAGASTGNLFNYENADSTMKTTYPRINTGGAEATFVTDGTNWQVIDEAMGQVPMVRAYLSAAQENIANDTATLVELNAETYDIGSNFNTGTYMFVCPVPGYYYVCGKLNWTSMAADKKVTANIYNEGANICGNAFHTAVADTTISSAIENTIHCAILDEIQLYGRHINGDAVPDIQGGTTATYIIVQLISKD